MAKHYQGLYHGVYQTGIGIIISPPQIEFIWANYGVVGTVWGRFVTSLSQCWQFMWYTPDKAITLGFQGSQGFPLQNCSHLQTPTVMHTYAAVTGGGGGWGYRAPGGRMVRNLYWWDCVLPYGSIIGAVILHLFSPHEGRRPTDENLTRSLISSANICKHLDWMTAGFTRVKLGI